MLSVIFFIIFFFIQLILGWDGHRFRSGPNYHGSHIRRNSSKMGIPKLGVVNGQPVGNPSKYPFMAWQGDDSLGFFCGGTLIHPDWVLTAAHCLYDSPEKQKDVYVQLHRDDYSVPLEQEGGLVRGLSHWIPHPEFVDYSYDIALLKLNESVPKSAVIPILLDDGRGGRGGEDSSLIGWGSTDVQCNNYLTVLLQGDMVIGTEQQCNQAAGKDWYNQTIELCAGKQLHGRSWVEAGCGDSGGPLLIKQDGSLVQTGITSWGYGNTYTIYTRVSFFNDWISSVINTY